MSHLPILQFAQLHELAEQAASIATPCNCPAQASAGWITEPATLNGEQFLTLGTLLTDAYAEPTFDEYHPQGTRYYSADAPIAPRYYPYNRSQVCQCVACRRIYLRYTEGGGYFTDKRIRLLQSELLIDACQPPE